MAIFSDMVEKTIGIFMDDFSVMGNSFDNCLANLRAVLARCEETNLVLNWEKCHFMVLLRPYDVYKFIGVITKGLLFNP